jgi:hypothetical protein
MIDNAKDTISKWIEKEHRIVANVQKTMVALLKTMSEVNSISRGGNVGCTSPPLLVGLSMIG